MGTDHDKNEEQIYYQAVSLPPEQREAYLRQVCGGDARLLERIRRLLIAHDQADSFLEGSAAGVTIESPAPKEGPGTRIGRYELLELLGEGGMGLVYLAQQQEPVKRRVALKIIKPGMDSRQVIARFEAERQALAVLDHPNIAHVFDAGCTETGSPAGAGRPYFVMEHVKGMSITRYCDEHKLPIEQRLRLFEQVCEAVQHAHQKGIIHRDLKPSNILVTMQGDRPVPKIIDFGIAKATTQSLTQATMFTYQGQFLGTPEYMSPEQADMATQDIDTRSDIYSLGVVLYELLAGVLPFEGESLTKLGLAEIQRTIREVEPASPSVRLTQMGDKAKGIADSRGTQVVPLARRLHRELEWIPLKAMRKDRCRRYRSASEMADDVRNYLNGLPLLAGPETAVYRVQKFVRKHAGFVTTVVLVAAAIVVGLVVSTAMYFQSESMRVQAEQAKKKEAQARIQAETAEAAAEQKALELRRTHYVNTVQLADAKYREGNVGGVRTLLESCPDDVRGWEWDRVNHVLDHSLMSFSSHANSIAQSPDGKRVISGGANGDIQVWDITTGKELSKFPGAHKGSIDHIEFSPDGNRIVSCSDAGEVKVWDTADFNTPITSIRHGWSWIPCASFNPDGNRIVSACNADGTIKVWDVTTGAEIRTFGRQKGGTRQSGGVRFVGFNPNGKHVVSADGDGIITIWDSVRGDEVMSFAAHDQEIRTMSFNSDGSRFASGSSDNTIKIWDGITGSIVMTLRGHDGPIGAVAFSPDDKYVISGSWDSTVRIWDAATGKDIRNLRGHERFVTSVGFTPDKKRAVSLAWDGKIIIWDVQVDREIHRFLGHASLVGSAAFSPDGKRLVSNGIDGIVKVWDLTHFAEMMTFGEGSRGIPCPVALSPDGKRIASLNRARAIVIRDVETRDEVITFGSQEDKVGCLTYSPDGRHIVSGSTQGRLKLWDENNGEEVMTFSEKGAAVISLAFSPDGHRIVSGLYDKTIRVWDVASGTQLQSLVGHGRTINDVTFSPDGKYIASACQDDGTAKIWDAQTGKELKTLRGHGDILISVAYSPDGRRLITGSRDGTARVWDSSTGDELLTLRAGSPVTEVVFSPDGKSIAGCTFGGAVVLWESAAPADGYGPRKKAEMARNIVDELHKTHGFYLDVIDQVEADTTLDEPVRKVALQIANSRKVEDVETVAEEGWEIVSSADKEIHAYQAVIDKARKVARSEPQNASVPRTLGVGQYRIGAYTDALETLKKAEKTRTDRKLGSDPSSAAFLAMTQYQLGQVDEARAAIKIFRQSLESKIWQTDFMPGQLSAWIEAEQVIAGVNEPLPAIWDLIRKQKLDRAVTALVEFRSAMEETDRDLAYRLEGVSQYLSRACYARGKSRLLDSDQGYIDRSHDYEAALCVDPNFVSALLYLAWLRVISPVEEVRIPTRAVEEATRACELTDWKVHNGISTLAAACSETGDFDAAVKWQKRATALLPDNAPTALRAHYETRCRVYQSGKPYHKGSLWSFSEGELVAHWTFDEVENGEVLDATGMKLHGRLMGNAQIVSDRERGGVLRLPGKGDYVDCGWNSAFDITGAMTIAAWIKVTGLDSRWEEIVSTNNYGLGLLGLNDDPNHVGPGFWSTNLAWIESEKMDVDNRWHHIVVLYDGQEFAMYIDGNKLCASKCYYKSLPIDTGPLYIGQTRENYRNEGWKDGLIDDVRIYSYALSAEEVKRLHEGKEPPQSTGL